ncbi:DUF1566 domain-containing protein [Methylicorpusculum sp.]|uniref:Lcl domain-containing protein n=1 Tax=Methylicorpusculum sp. TaxID=2713644 RepID=UPI00271CA5A9|nr:DUF1566 domain-containing protein [Methylicorpusculum sp.]MDO8845117.1 DUF1566 domain-containing protein [Methylicorpusculum sp.]MDP2180722.1 DUF1566 domain-containing protein [Methylicorpusculum sp.]MDZ4154004.1 DUF1566 domain-containing protein [Methylicorpusculum sp.]
MNMKESNWAAAGLILTLTLINGTAQATLHDRGNGLVYDDVLNVTWLQNANLAATESFGVGGINALGLDNGSMHWETANTWINAMNAYANGSGWLGYNDWRLPTISPVNGMTFNLSISVDGSTDIGYNITSSNSELAYMFNMNLNNVGQYDTSGGLIGCWPICLQNTGPFENLQAGSPWFYWSGVEYMLEPYADSAWGFITHGYYQGLDNKAQKGYVWPVRPGDVTVIPIPGAIWLFGTGLLGLLRLARRGNIG